MSKPKLVSDFDAQKTLVAVYTGRRNNFGVKK